MHRDARKLSSKLTRIPRTANLSELISPEKGESIRASYFYTISPIVSLRRPCREACRPKHVPALPPGRACVTPPVTSTVKTLGSEDSLSSAPPHPRSQRTPLPSPPLSAPTLIPIRSVTDKVSPRRPRRYLSLASSPFLRQVNVDVYRSSPGGPRIYHLVTRGVKMGLTRYTFDQSHGGTRGMSVLHATDARARALRSTC